MNFKTYDIYDGNHTVSFQIYVIEQLFQKHAYQKSPIYQDYFIDLANGKNKLLYEFDPTKDFLHPDIVSYFHTDYSFIQKIMPLVDFSQTLYHQKNQEENMIKHMMLSDLFINHGVMNEEVLYHGIEATHWLIQHTSHLFDNPSQRKKFLLSFAKKLENLSIEHTKNQLEIDLHPQKQKNNSHKI